MRVWAASQPASQPARMRVRACAGSGVRWKLLAVVLPEGEHARCECVDVDVVIGCACTLGQVGGQLLANAVTCAVRPGREASLGHGSARPQGEWHLGKATDTKITRRRRGRCRWWQLVLGARRFFYTVHRVAVPLKAQGHAGAHSERVAERRRFHRLHFKTICLTPACNIPKAVRGSVRPTPIQHP